MIKYAVGALAALALTGIAHAGEIRPMQPTSVSLGSVSGVIYYSDAGGGEYRIVATLASGKDATPMRVVTTLVSGQRMILSVPLTADQRPLEVEFARRGDSVFVSSPEAAVD